MLPHQVGDIPYVAIFFDFSVKLDSARAVLKNICEQWRASASGGRYLIEREVCDRCPIYLRVMKGDQLAVTRPADVKLYHIRADVNGFSEGLERVFRNSVRYATMSDDECAIHAAACPECTHSRHDATGREASRQALDASVTVGRSAGLRPRSAAPWRDCAGRRASHQAPLSRLPA